MKNTLEKIGESILIARR